VSRAALLIAVLLTALLAAPAAGARTATTATTAPTRTIDAGGVKLAYRTIGTGRPLVLVQGVTGTMDAWDPALVDALAAAGHRVVLYDHQGMGRSARRPGTLTLPQMADDAAGLIEALNLRRADVLGYSMGGMVAQALAVRHPRRVRRLVLAASAPGDGKATFPIGEAASVLADVNGGPFEDLRFMFPADARGARDAYVARTTKRRGADRSGTPEANGAQLAASGPWLLGRLPEGARVKELRLPVLVAGGGRDELLPPANQRHLARVIPGARRVVYPRASHGFLFQHARAFARAVDRFLAG
jgi:pimeloyl-ACP methyl ester carboxylesterase